MRLPKRAWISGTLILLLPLILNCNYLAQSTMRDPGGAENGHTVQTLPVVVSTPDPTPSQTLPPISIKIPTLEPVLINEDRSSIPADLAVGEPAGCLSSQQQNELKSNLEMLEYADRLLGLPRPLSRRLLPGSYNEYTGQYNPAGDSTISLSVDDIQNVYWVQKILNALQVAGFVTWLRDSSQHGLHILAIPLTAADGQETGWAPYIQAYWKDRWSVPEGDSTVIPALKLPPCDWMVEQGVVMPVEAGWFLDRLTWPDYAAAAEPYLANSTEAAGRVAGKIDWLGEEGTEGPNTMCGPLVWAIMHQAGALPPDFGAWSLGPKSFWLARPKTNGRPWSLFPPEIYQVYHFAEPLGEFDFRTFHLYPGDFLYTYSKGDGYDHMLVVTEVDSSGNVFTVTNRIQVTPDLKTTVERALLLNLNDLEHGLARQNWNTDRKNGRTGHSGFDVFRWAWMDKDILGQPVAYTVQPGDTLSLIAERWRTPVDLIAGYNREKTGAVLAIGQVIEIPPNKRTGR